MNVLVTGGAGFIGSHTVDRLISRGVQVIVVDDLSTGNWSNLNPAAVFVELDIVSARLAEVFQRFQPEYVIHLAAQVSVPKSLDDPLKDCRTNVQGCLNLLENCRRYGTGKIVYASSAAVYGNPDEAIVSEETPTLPLSFYGVSKLAAEYYLRVYQHLYGLRFTVLRYANVYGPRQDSSGEGGVVAVFASAVLAGRSPLIFGDGEQTRDFVYVEDVAAANIKALTGGDQMVLNLGTGRRTAVNELYSLISGLAGTDLKPVYAAPRAGDIRHSGMENRRAAAALGWQPEFTLAGGLAKTLDFYRKSGL